MNLRPYQKKALYSIKKEYLAGVNKQVIVLATGLGKTVIFSQLISDITKHYNRKALVLVHREELLNQAKEKLLAVNPDLDIGLEMAEQRADGDHHVVIASVATIGRAASPRIQKFNPDDFVVIVTDEAHHASASTYKNVYKHFGVLKEENDTNKQILMLGVTATPSRNDNEGIDKIYDKVTYEYGIIKGIENGFLSPIRAYRVDTETDLSQVKKVAGDFNQGELGDAVNNNERNAAVVKAYLERVPGKQALVFAVHVKHTIALTEAFQRIGIAAGFVTGETPKEERRQLLVDFNTKKLKVLINCAVLTEGFDEPNIDAILMARPTQSGILFQQMIGRGTRLAEGKDYLTIIDFVDNTYRQRLQTTASLLGIPGKLDFKGEDILAVKGKLDELLELAPNTDLDTFDISKIDYAIEEVDILSGLKIPEEISQSTTLDWHKHQEGLYALSLPDKRKVFIQQQMTGEFMMADEWYDPEERMKKQKTIGTSLSLDQALAQTDHYVLSTYPEYGVLVSTTSRWRKLPPTSGQITQLQKMGVDFNAVAQLDRGRASRLLTKLFSYSKGQRRTKFSGQIH